MFSLLENLNAKNAHKVAAFAVWECPLSLAYKIRN